eukprot:gene19035-38220_t
MAHAVCGMGFLRWVAGDSLPTFHPPPRTPIAMNTLHFLKTCTALAATSVLLVACGGGGAASSQGSTAAAAATPGTTSTAGAAMSVEEPTRKIMQSVTGTGEGAAPTLTLRAHANLAGDVGAIVQVRVDGVVTDSDGQLLREETMDVI